MYTVYPGTLNAIIGPLVPPPGYITSSQWETATLAGAIIAQLTHSYSATINAKPSPPPPPAPITPFGSTQGQRSEVRAHQELPLKATPQLFMPTRLLFSPFRSCRSLQLSPWLGPVSQPQPDGKQ